MVRDPGREQKDKEVRGWTSRGVQFKNSHVSVPAEGSRKHVGGFETHQHWYTSERNYETTFFLIAFLLVFNVCTTHIKQ